MISFERRIAQASEYRDRRGVDPKLRRIVWSESDGLPGVIIDRYGDHFVLQTLTLAMDMRKDLIVEAIEMFFVGRALRLPEPNDWQAGRLPYNRSPSSNETMRRSATRRDWNYIGRFARGGFADRRSKSKA